MTYIHCRTCYVDTNRLVFDAVSFDGNSFIKDVSYADTGLRQSGQIAHIEIGDTVVVDVQGQGVNKLLEHYCSRQENEEGQVQNVAGRGGAPEANQALPGDRFISGPDGTFVELLRGGMAAIGASPLCQTIYLALEGLVRTVCLNSELISSGGRLYSLNDGGKITTRACFNSKDLCFSKGAAENAQLESENFEFQIDFTEDGFTLFVGELDKETNKRKNNLVLTIKQNGDLHLISGDRVIFNLYPSGAAAFKMMDANRKVIYNKSVVTTDLYDEVTGTRHSKAVVDSVAANIVEVSAAMNRKVSGINVSEIKAVPNTSVTIK